MSDIRERIPDLKPSPAVDDPEQARFRLFDSITAFLKSTSRGQPLVIILDNLHWADKPSLLLLEFLAQEFSDSRLLVVGTYRDVDLSRQHPLAETLGELTRERLFQRVLLSGLSQEDVGRFIEITSGITPPSGLVRAVHTQTEGNPLFVTEVVRLLVQEGELSHVRTGERDSWEVRIPEGVREVIGRRLNRLSQRCNETLTIASVIGREFELRQLEGLMEDMSQDRLLEVLEEALSARVIGELPQAVGRYEFTHALMRQTLYEELTTTRRVRLHARIINALEHLYGDEADTHAAELAHHAVEAEAVLGAEKLIRFSKIAGDRSLAAYAYEEALNHFRRALVPKESQPVDSETADVLFALGRAQVATFITHEMEEAINNLRRAFDYYTEAGDATGAAAVAESLPPGAQLLGLAELTERALSMVPGGTLQEGRVLSRHGLDLGRVAVDYEGAEAAFDRALDIARQFGDIKLEVRTLANAADVGGHHLRWERRLERSLLAVSLTQDADDLYAESLARFHATLALLRRGEPAATRRHAEAGQAVSERLRDRHRLRSALAVSQMLAQAEGNWEAASGLRDRIAAITPHRFGFSSYGMMLAFEKGEFKGWEEETDTALESLRNVAAQMGSAINAFAYTLAARIAGQAEWPQSVAVALTDILSSSGHTPAWSRVACAALGLIAEREGDKSRAHAQYEALESERGTMLGYTTSSADRVLGILAQTMGEFDIARAHFEDSLAFCRKAGYRPELAWSLCDYADLRLESDGEGDRQRVATLLDESLAISSDLGMRPLMERVLSRKMKLQGIDVSSPQTSILLVVSSPTPALSAS